MSIYVRDGHGNAYIASVPPQAILTRFELPVIERYFPEFPRAMAARFR